MPRKNENPKKEKVVKKEKVENEQKVKVEFDDFKDEVYKYTDEVVRKYYLNEIEKINKVVIRDKNKKILFRNFIITLLLLVIVYLLYLLTTVNFFTRMSEKNYKENNSNEKTEEIVPSKEEKYEPSFNELKETYSYLLDSIVINDKCKYLKDYYNGNLTSELKNYLALNNLDFKKLDVVDDYNMFSEALLKDSFENLFIDEYESVSFNYNGNDIRYISKLNAYITNETLYKTKSSIKREIINISVDGDIVMITTIEGITKDGKLYNALSNEEIEEYKGDNIINYSDRLNKITYTFDNKKLTSIK